MRQSHYWKVFLARYLAQNSKTISIAWQLAHTAGRHFAAGEYDAERTLAGGYRLEGRLDRLDQAPDGGIILDYKTGRAPKQQEVDTGEAVQLPSYALLSETLPARVEYLELDGKVATGSALQGAELATLTRAVQQRLETLLQDIVHGVPLPAWGDAETCRHCDFDGLCRKPAWTEPVR
jgi:ATP-dependent helicase/nuclease subunit B